jgi:glycosyltransferase involved in cell wall biosynthesis
LKKVVIFYPHITEYGGIERNIIALAIEINNQNLEPVLLCYYDKINMRKHSGDILSTAVLADHWNPFIKGLKLRRYLKKHQNEIQGMPFYFCIKSAFYGALSCKKDYVLHYTDPPSLLSKHLEVNRIKRLLNIPRRMLSDLILRQGVKKASLCLTMTKINAIELKSIYNRSFSVVHQGGLPYERDKTIIKKCNSTTLRLFSICRLTKSKNLNWIIDASHNLLNNESFRNTFNNLEVVIAGKGPELNNLFELANQLGLSSNISFPGFLNSEELELAYENADLFLVPGKQGFGLPVLEALYREIPVVVNVESRVSEILSDNSWVAISANTSKSFSENIILHLQSIKNEYPDKLQLVVLPTEQKWASQIGTYCKWWK